ncbi:Ribosome recycling factor, partial [hydrothermal vent metagenome]
SDKSISEDDSFKAHENVQKMTDTYTKDIDVILEEKSKSLLEV